MKKLFLTSSVHAVAHDRNALHLLKESNKTGFIDLIKDLVINQGKVYIGTSAGSIIAGEKCPDYLLEKTDMLELADQAGYGFVNFTILPHWGSEHFRDMYLKGRIEIAYKDNQVPLLLLTDTQYVLVEDYSYKIIEVK
jgi:peptidase E